jgi:hypothetical protein
MPRAKQTPQERFYAAHDRARFRGFKRRAVGGFYVDTIAGRYQASYKEGYQHCETLEANGDYTQVALILKLGKLEAIR